MKSRHLVPISFAALFSYVLSLPAFANDAGRTAYPSAPRDNTVDHYFGTAVPDPYRWMENSRDPALHKWVDASVVNFESVLVSPGWPAVAGHD